MLRWLAGAAAAGAPEGSSSPQQGAAAVITAAISWVIISGRVLQLVATQLAAPAASESGEPSTSRQGDDSSDGGDSESSEWVTDSGSDSDDGVATVVFSLLHHTATAAVSGLRAWLQKEGVGAAMSAAGYDPSGTGLLQQLQAVCGEGEASDASSSSSTMGATTVVMSDLQSLVQKINSLPFACACNNPACSNLDGPLELQLVNGKGSVCGGCHVSRFSRACQVQHWKHGHKPECRAIAAAAAAAASATGAPPPPPASS